MIATAADIMTRSVISTGPNTAVSDIATLLAKHGISAIPVIDVQGQLLGMVSEGDLMKPFLANSNNRREWWLELLAEGERLAPEYLQYIAQDWHTAKDVMTKAVVTATPDTTTHDLAGLLVKHHIKRVPIIDGASVVGIVSRADIVHTLADSVS
ncbi:MULTISPECIES: CBS domain-containing protein [unclassified Acidocella]|uniref:CBS domain-containing protein n=1 Tax=unclassified Acidocella TaxID=2648610 RepID=UPI00028DE516|nr:MULTISPECIES: CBS domain-containing protein [unclassified Acidocella]EKM98067.1 signal-transduction protein with CBS domains [Acidocella sp. MX-AZ02]WBO59425.1 CBS domain-containing protein [Acidocella sp. MX-AZ03]